MGQCWVCYRGDPTKERWRCRLGRGWQCEPFRQCQCWGVLGWGEFAVVTAVRVRERRETLDRGVIEWKGEPGSATLSRECVG